MLKFAKLFETEEHGQILVKVGSNDKGPDLTVYFQHDALGIGSKTYTFDDTKSDWETVGIVFENFTEKDAIEQVERARKEQGLGGLDEDSREGE